MASRKSRRRTLSADERALWDHVARSVRRAVTDAPLSEPEKEAGEESPVSTPRKPLKKRAYLTPPLEQPSPPKREALSAGALHEMDGNTGRRLKRGKLSIDAKLDLHGHTQEQAHRALVRFIGDAHRHGLRTVLVVTGKGGRDGAPGILWRAVPNWLNDSPLRQWVSGFTHATQKDGGTGALYVRVKRRRTD